MSGMNEERSQQSLSVVLLFAPSTPDEVLLQRIEQKFDVSSDTIVFGALCEDGENDLDGHRLSPEAATVLRNMLDIKNGMVVAAVIDTEHEVTIDSTKRMFQ